MRHPRPLVGDGRSAIKVCVCVCACIYIYATPRQRRPLVGDGRSAIKVKPAWTVVLFRAALEGGEGEGEWCVSRCQMRPIAVSKKAYYLEGGEGEGERRHHIICVHCVPVHHLDKRDL